jgi:hypothetical protein
MSIIHSFGKRSGMGSTDGQTTKISNLKEGDLFRKIGKEQVYVFDDRVALYRVNGEFKRWVYRFLKYGKKNQISYDTSHKDIDIIRVKK